MEEKTISGKKKAAVLLAGLGIESAEKILSQLDKNIADELKLLMEDLTAGDMEILRNIHCQLASEAEETKSMDDNLLMEILKWENPKTTALFLALLEPEYATFIMKKLPESIVSDVARRITYLDRTSPQLFPRLKQLVGKKFIDGKSIDAEKMIEIIQCLDAPMGDQLVYEIENKDKEISKKIADGKFVFEEIVYLSDEKIKNFIMKCDLYMLGNALKTASVEVIEKITENMTEYQRDALKAVLERGREISFQESLKSQQAIISLIK